MTQTCAQPTSLPDSPCKLPQTCSATTMTVGCWPEPQPSITKHESGLVLVSQQHTPLPPGAATKNGTNSVLQCSATPPGSQQRIQQRRPASWLAAAPGKAAHQRRAAPAYMHALACLQAQDSWVAAGWLLYLPSSCSSTSTMLQAALGCTSHSNRRRGRGSKGANSGTNGQAAPASQRHKHMPQAAQAACTHMRGSACVSTLETRTAADWGTAH